MWFLSIERMLENSRFKISGTATSYNEAITDLPFTKADLALIDINLSGKKTGIDLAVYINKYLSIPFIIQSSESDLSTIREVISTAPVDFLLKPFSRERFLNTLNSACMLIECNKEYSGAPRAALI